jgi:hypothetical protein
LKYFETIELWKGTIDSVLAIGFEAVLVSENGDNKRELFESDYIPEEYAHLIENGATFLLIEGYFYDGKDKTYVYELFFCDEEFKKIIEVDGFDYSEKQAIVDEFYKKIEEKR